MIRTIIGCLLVLAGLALMIDQPEDILDLRVALSDFWWWLFVTFLSILIIIIGGVVINSGITQLMDPRNGSRHK